ncbi:MAG: thioredoxin family protein [Chthoniobacterales bacterium]|nr:thioredoxin family protein [Chthoniobacterales bacterium]
MATTALHSIPVGTILPDRELLDVVTNEHVRITERPFSKGILVIILCAHCPYVEHIKLVLKKLASLFMPQGIAFVGVSANDPEQYPEDAPEKLRKMVLEEAFSFSILFDETQEFVKALGAVCTPDFFLFDHHLRLAYHGRLDASTPKNGVPLTGADLNHALETLCAGKTIAEPFPLSLGCSIKWKESA